MVQVYPQCKSSRQCPGRLSGPLGIQVVIKRHDGISLDFIDHDLSASPNR